ncbi:MAG: DUF393 domain-containing protein [Bacteroidetes bacterium]|nr:DUF393 domain-containing protein [Bacteroidota bacterium]
MSAICTNHHTTGSKKKFKFSTLSGSFQFRIKQYYAEKKQTTPNSVLLFSRGKFLAKSNAVLTVAYQLGGWWKLLFIFWMIPSFIRDGIYDFIAQKRHQWYKDKIYCNFSTKELQERLIQ